MNKVFGIDLGTTYSCIAYIDESGKPVVLKNAEGNLTTPSVVFFESPTEISVGDSAKENSVLYPDQVVSLIKRMMGKPGFSRTINGIEMKPEEISAYTLKKLVNDAEDSLREQGKLEEGEHVKDVVITCPAYFGVAEREATKTAGEIAGLNVLDIINEPTAAAINYGVSSDGQEKTVLVYDLGGGTFDVTMINIKGGDIRVVCTGGDDELGGRDWDDKILMYLAEQFQDETGISDNILEDNETLQELGLAAERAKKLLSSKPKAPILVKYEGDSARIELTREQFYALTEDLLTRSIEKTRDMFREAEAKGFHQSDVSEILLVGGSSRMPQVAERVKAEFGIETKMFEPDEAVAKGAAIFANQRSAYNIVLEAIAQQEGKSVEEVKEEASTGKIDVQQAASRFSLGGDITAAVSNTPTIINVSSRSFGLIALSNGERKLCNIILKNADLPAQHTEVFTPAADNQVNVALEVKESLTTEDVVDVELGKDVGVATLELPAGCTRNTLIEVTFNLDESGLLHLHAVEKDHGREVDAEFQTVGAMTEEEKSAAISRALPASVM